MALGTGYAEEQGSHSISNTYTGAGLTNLKRAHKMVVYVINLERRHDRRTAIIEQLHKINLSPTWIDAIDGQKSAFQATHKQTLERTGLKPSELACYFSHLAALEAVASGREQHAVILEDDAIICNDFSQTVQDASPWLTWCPVIRLSALKKQVGHTLATNLSGHRIILPTKSTSGSHGYMASKEGAKMLLSKLAHVKLPIDTAMDHYWLLGVPIASISPPVVSENNASPSDIAIAGRMDVSRNHRFWARIERSLIKKIAIRYLQLKIKYRRARRK